MAKPKLKATAEMAAALELKQLHEDVVAAEQQAERADRDDVRQRLGDQVDQMRARGEVVARETVGPVNVLSRDGLLWLIRKGRLNAAQRTAAERFRHDFAIVHLGGVGSCIAQSSGSGAVDMTMVKVQAASELDRARRVALLRDDGLVAIVDAVVGRGETVRDCARGSQPLAELLEAELGVALRLLAKFYETDRLTNYLKSVSHS